MIGSLTLNGQEAEATFGIVVTDFTGDLGMPARTLNFLDIPAGAGGIDPGVTPHEAARVLTIPFLVSVATDVLLRTTLDAIAEVCGTGLVEIKSLYSPTRALYGVLQSLDAARRDATIAGWAQGSMQFVCPQPYWWATTQDTIGFGAAPVAIPLGTAPSTGRDGWSALIEIVGAATTPTLNWRKANGDLVSSMAFTISPVAGDSIVCDLGRRLVYKFVSGVRTNAISSLTAGYAFPDLDISSGGSYVGSQWPTLDITSGTANIKYKRAFR
jgi:hypothetical protein